MAGISLWSFCEKVYAQPAVEEVCLQLQDEQGVNVLVLLCCTWLDAHARFPTAEQLVEAIEWTTKASSETVVPIRKLRRALKSDKHLSQSTLQQMRVDLLKAELAAEKDLLMQLEARFTALGSPSSAGANKPLELLARYYQLEPRAKAFETLRRASGFTSA